MWEDPDMWIWWVGKAYRWMQGGFRVACRPDLLSGRFQKLPGEYETAVGAVQYELSAERLLLLSPGFDDWWP